MIINDLITLTNKRLDILFDEYLKKIQVDAPDLVQSMYYAVANGGKRLRPLLVYATGLSLSASLDDLDIPACAVEIIHSYSLVHDDLPAMDNADLRRGKPSCHKKFNEALAILAGDALQPLAFEIITSHPANLDSSQRLKMIQLLAYASGYQGMAAGQALDMSGTHHIYDLVKMYQLKTGALLSASVKLGMIAANVTDIATIEGLTLFADKIGLAFQLQDDLLDIESCTESLGKPQGIDNVNHKTTYVTFAGQDATHQKVQTLFIEAMNALEPLGSQSLLLKELAKLILQRKK